MQLPIVVRPILHRIIIAVLMLAAAACGSAHGEPNNLNNDSSSASPPLFLTVRLASEPELKNLTFVHGDKILAHQMTGQVLVGALFGAAALPVGAAYAAYFVVVLPAMMLFDIKMDSSQRKSLADHIQSANLPSLAEQALRRRITFAEGLPPTGSNLLEVIITGYGFVQPERDGDVCFFLDAQMRLVIDEHEVINEPVIMEPRQHSDDAPPAFCTEAKRFSKKYGELANQALSDGAEILAGIVAERVRKRLGP